jgi:hypothetical protein
VVFAISASKATPTAISERVNSALLVDFTSIAAEDVAKVVESIKLKNTDTDSQLGIRTATITYTNITGNESVSATVSLKDAQRGFIINGESVSDLSGISVSNAGDVNGVCQRQWLIS